MSIRDTAKALGLSRAMVHRLAKLGMPVEGKEGAKGWLKVHRPDIATRLGLAVPEVPVPGPEATAGLMGRVERTEQMVAALVEKAANGVPLQAGQALRLHGLAVRNLIDARRLDAEDRVRVGELVEREKVLAAWTRLNGELRSLIVAMPRALAPRIAPADPGPAEAILETWVLTFLRRLSRTDGAPMTGGDGGGYEDSPPPSERRLWGKPGASNSCPDSPTGRNGDSMPTP